MSGVAARLCARSWRSRPLRFVAVGGLNTLACWLLFAGLVRAGIDYRLANFTGLLFGIGCSFLGQSRLVFDDRGAGRIGRFALLWLLLYLVQTALIGLLIGRGIAPAPAGLIVLPLVVIAAYLAQRRLVFAGAGDAR